MLAAACLALGWSNAPAVADRSNNTVVFAHVNILESADVYFNTVSSGNILAFQIWDTLIYRDPVSGDYKPSLATSWRWADETTLELDLRRGVKFHNGEEFDADDVVHTLNFVTDPKNAISLDYATWIAGAEKVDKYKVRIKAKSVFPPAIEYLTGPRLAMYPNEYYAKVGPAGMHRNPVGTGPYRVERHDVGKSITLKRNENYFQDGPKAGAQIDTVVIRFIPDVQTQTAELLSGGVDLIMDISNDQAMRIASLPRFRIVSTELVRANWVRINTRENTPFPMLKDIRVRQAIAHAINRESIVKNLVGEGSRVLHAPCHPLQTGCIEEGVKKYEYDPEKSKRLLTEAGYPNGFAVDIHAYRNRPLTEAIIGDLRAVGIRANLRFVQLSTITTDVHQNKVGLIDFSWGASGYREIAASTSLFFTRPEDDLNQDPTVVESLLLGNRTLDPEKRNAAYKKGLARLADQALAVPLYSIPTRYASTADLEAVGFSDGLPRFHAMRWR
jgi:peptide/nickel transport system substrate-binding protein